MSDLVSCAIALGANLPSSVGDPQATLEAAIVALSQQPKLTVTAQSSWYSTPPVGPPQPDYVNGCIVIETSIEPQDLMTMLHEIEAQFGRERRERWGARTLDLDLLFYGDRIVDTERLQVPHPRLQERAFVLVPLAEITPGWVDPRSNLTIEKYCQMVDCSEVKLQSKF